MGAQSKFIGCRVALTGLGGPDDDRCTVNFVSDWRDTGGARTYGRSLSEATDELES